MAPDRETDVDDLITAICREVDGVGETKARAVAADFAGDLQGFLVANKARFGKITRSNNSPILNPRQVGQIFVAKGSLPRGQAAPETWAFYIGKRFLGQQVERLRGLTLDTLDINPFLVNVLELKTPRLVIEFNLFQSVTRSVLTAWGSGVE